MRKAREKGEFPGMVDLEYRCYEIKCCCCGRHTMGKPLGYSATPDYVPRPCNRCANIAREIEQKERQRVYRKRKDEEYRKFLTEPHHKKCQCWDCCWERAPRIIVLGSGLAFVLGYVVMIIIPYLFGLPKQ